MFVICYLLFITVTKVRDYSCHLIIFFNVFLNYYYDMPRHLTPIEVSRAIGMLDGGMRQSDVAVHFNISQSVVSRLLKRFRETGSESRRPGQGRKRKTTRAQDHFIALSARRNPSTTSVLIRQQLENATGINITAKTVRRRLAEVNLVCRRPMRGPSLTNEHKRRRLQWAIEHQYWEAQWNNVLFTDESRFGLYSDSRRIREWRHKNTARHLGHVQEIHPFRGGTIMVWAGIAMGRRTQLYICDGSMNGLTYARDIINGLIAPIAQEMGEFTLLDDNAPPHRTRDVIAAIENNGINHLRLPALSPDLNPIEAGWDMLQRALDHYQPPVQNLAQLRAVLPILWNNLPQESLDNLVRSMPRRIRAVLEVRGGHTQY